MTYNNNTLYLCLIFALGYIFLGIESYVPAGRLGHSSILVGNKIYFFGGLVNLGSATIASNDAFYLDLSQSFNVSNPPWTPITNIPFGSSWAALTLDNSNNGDIYLFGGLMFDMKTQNDSFQSFIYRFNVNTQTWNVPNVKGTAPQRRIEAKAICDNSRKIHIFGGAANFLVGSQNRIFLNDLIDYNIADSSWTVTTAVKGRAAYSSTLLPNGIIVFIGGFESFNGNNDIQQNVDITQILLYDTNSLTWSTKTAKIIASIAVESRQRHSAVLTPDGQIIIYGGTRSTTGIDFDKASPDVLVFDTKKDPFEITVPTLTTNIGNYPSLTAHSADLYGNLMIVAFGNITKVNAEPDLNFNENIYVMDIKNFTWVKVFDLNQSTSPSSPNSQTSGNGNGNDGEKMTVIILASVFGVVGAIALIVGGFFLYRWYKRRQRENDKPAFFGSQVDRYEDDVGIPGTPVGRYSEHEYRSNIPIK